MNRTGLLPVWEFAALCVGLASLCRTRPGPLRMRVRRGGCPASLGQEPAGRQPREGPLWGPSSLAAWICNGQTSSWDDPSPLHPPGSCPVAAGADGIERVDTHIKAAENPGDLRPDFPPPSHELEAKGDRDLSARPVNPSTTRSSAEPGLEESGSWAGVSVSLHLQLGNGVPQSADLVGKRHCWMDLRVRVQDHRMA